MNAADLDIYCATLPGAKPDRPFGPDTQTWKVGGKMFALYREVGEGISLKCDSPQTAALLIELGRAKSAPYLKRGGWVLVPWSMDSSELRERLATSYRIVRQSLPKAVQREFAPFPDHGVSKR